MRAIRRDGLPERVRQAGWSGAEAAAGPLASLLVTGGLVRALGPQDYGVLVVVLAVSAFSTAINPAIALTATKLVSEAAGRQEPRGNIVARLITASLALVAALSFVILLAAGVLADPLSKLVFGARLVAHSPTVPRVLWLSLLAACLQQIDATVGAAIKGLERFKPQALFEVSSRLAVAVVVVAVGWRLRDLASVLFTQCAALALSTLLRAIVLRSVAPGARILARPQREDLARMLSFGRWMWLNAIATGAYTSLDRVVVGRILGPAAAAEFFVYVQLSQLIHFIPNSLSTFSFPVFSRLRSQGQIGSIRDLYRRLLGAVAVLALVIALAVGLFQHAALGVFTGRVFQHGSHATLDILIGGFFLLALNIAPYYLLLGLGASRLVSLVTAMSGAVALVMTFVLVPIMGLEGAALARLLYVLGTLTLLERAFKALQRL